MKKRNIFAVLALSLITFGIYDLYWLVKTKNVLNKNTKVHTPTVWLLIAPILILLVAIIAVAVLVGNGSNTSATIVVFLIYAIAFVSIVPITFFWYFKFSKAISEYTRGELSTGVTFLLLWLLHFIGVMIVQDKFNDMLDAQQVAEGTGDLMKPGAATGAPTAQQSSPQPPVINLPTPPPTPQATPEQQNTTTTTHSDSVNNSQDNSPQPPSQA